MSRSSVPLLPRARAAFNLIKEPVNKMSIDTPVFVNVTIRSFCITGREMACIALFPCSQERWNIRTLWIRIAFVDCIPTWPMFESFQVDSISSKVVHLHLPRHVHGLALPVRIFLSGVPRLFPRQPGEPGREACRREGQKRGKIRKTKSDVMQSSFQRVHYYRSVFACLL